MSASERPGAAGAATGTGAVPAGSPALSETALPLPLLHRGKVREVYEAGPDTLLMVATDRVSAFDVILSPPIPRKGEILTLVTAWWMERIEAAHPHHLLAVDPEEILRALPVLEGVPRERWARRSMLVRRTRPLLVECVIRGYIAGSAWKEYREGGTLAGEPLPAGLRESDRLPAPIFSPATKAQEGHDENIPYSEVVRITGEERAATLRARSLAIYAQGTAIAAERGILLADTKFEFGVDDAGRLLLIDELLTPDSSRFWPADRYEPGRGQPSYDKQPVRDWLERAEGWTGEAPAPTLPESVVAATTERYMEIFERLTGWHPDDFPLPRFGAEER